MEWIGTYLLGGVIPLMLCGCGIFFGCYLGFFYLRKPGAVGAALFGGGRESGRSSARALALALAGTLGVGNMVGVAAALVLGGPGAVLWMWVSALCAMILKYGEIVLAMRHRRRDGAGAFHGSAMCYLRDEGRRRGRPILGRLAATVFAALCLCNACSMGSILQVNGAAEALKDTFSLPTPLTGAVLAVLTFLVIRRGAEGVMGWTGRMVPLMTAGYLILSAAVLILRREALPGAIRTVIDDAFSPLAAGGGVLGFLSAGGVRYGTMRGLISNEAGCGTAPMAHATAHRASAAEQGVMGIFEVFVDTILLCTVTALVILVSPLEIGSYEGRYMSLTVDAYASALGEGAAGFLAVAVLFFAFATVICWAHYGMECLGELTKSRWARGSFVPLYAALCIVGATGASGWMWQMADLSIGGMTLINLSALLLCRREIREETRCWLSARRRRKDRRRTDREQIESR